MKPLLFFWLNPLVLGWVLIVLGIPLAMQKIPPNGFYGFRTAKTLSDSEDWYRANSYAGKAFILSGLASVVGAMAYRTFLQHFQLTRGNALAVMSCIEFGPVLAAMIASAVHVSRIKNDR